MSETLLNNPRFGRYCGPAGPADRTRYQLEDPATGNMISFSAVEMQAIVVAYLADLAGVQGTASSEELERLRAADGQRCRVCGCTEHYGCYPPCSWVEPDLCSTCVPANV